jgi:hypothetical protein
MAGGTLCSNMTQPLPAAFVDGIIDVKGRSICRLSDWESLQMLRPYG